MEGSVAGAAAPVLLAYSPLGLVPAVWSGMPYPVLTVVMLVGLSCASLGLAFPKVDTETVEGTDTCLEDGEDVSLTGMLAGPTVLLVSSEFLSHVIAKREKGGRVARIVEVRVAWVKMALCERVQESRRTVSHNGKDVVVEGSSGKRRNGCNSP